MLILLAVWLGTGVILMLIFHFATRKDRAAPVPPTKEEREPAKFISKKDVWSEPGGSDPPKPYE
jgi:hypothetical protein